MHVVDVAHHDWREQLEVVNQTLAEAGLNGRPIVLALNKADLVGPEELARRAREADALGFRAVAVSATTGWGLQDLTDQHAES